LPRASCKQILRIRTERKLHPYPSPKRSETMKAPRWTRADVSARTPGERGFLRSCLEGFPVRRRLTRNPALERRTARWWRMRPKLPA
jgi:hypothetical protein